MKSDPRWREVETALRTYVGLGTNIYLMYRTQRGIPRRPVVKIGVADDVERRRLKLRRDLNTNIITMGYCSASPKLEHELHRIFSDTRLVPSSEGTEWFTHEPTLDRLARILNALRTIYAPPTHSREPRSGWWPTPADHMLASALRGV